MGSLEHSATVEFSVVLWRYWVPSVRWSSGIFLDPWGWHCCLHWHQPARPLLLQIPRGHANPPCPAMPHYCRCGNKYLPDVRVIPPDAPEVDRGWIQRGPTCGCSFANQRGRESLSSLFLLADQSTIPRFTAKRWKGRIAAAWIALYASLSLSLIMAPLLIPALTSRVLIYHTDVPRQVNRIAGDLVYLKICAHSLELTDESK